MFYSYHLQRVTQNLGQRAISFFGKVGISGIKSEMQPLVKRACEDTAAADPKLSFVKIKGDLHPSTRDPGTSCVSLQCYGCTEVPGPDGQLERQQGSYWGSMHVLRNGAIKYNNEAIKSLDAAKRALIHEDDDGFEGELLREDNDKVEGELGEGVETEKPTKM